MRVPHKTRNHKPLRATRLLSNNLRGDGSSLTFGKNPRGPVSPPQSPPRLRRLGVRQAGEDRYSTQTSQARRTSLHSQSVQPRTKQEAVAKNIDSNAKTSVEKQAIHGDSSIPPNALARTTATVLKCPMCVKLFLSYHGLDVHLDSHESTAVKCWPCNLRFYSNKSLLQHQRLRHNKLKEENGPNEKGFHHLIFIDFSCAKFAAVSQNSCEMLPVQAACSIHDYSCQPCHKSFPMQAALDLHVSQHHYYPSKFICTLCHHDYKTKARLEQHKLNYPYSSKRHVADSKRKLLRALHLMPQCTAESLLRPKEVAPVNMEYYERLKGVPAATKMVYELAECESGDDQESDSSQ